MKNLKQVQKLYTNIQSYKSFELNEQYKDKDNFAYFASDFAFENKTLETT